jgi:hypothetical protein
VNETSLVVLLKRWLIDLDVLSLNHSSHLRLELFQVKWAERICLCNNWDQVDSRAKSFHNLNIQWLQCVASWANEVQACMYTQINLLCALWLLLLQHVRFMLVVEELNDGLP